jgi:hypothetical protein
MPLASVLLDETVDPPGGPLGGPDHGETGVGFEIDRQMAKRCRGPNG